MGGYTTGPAELVELLHQRSRPYLFSNSLAPALVGAALKALELLSADSASFIDTLASNVAHFRQGMAAVGFQLLGHPAHPICPILLGDAQLAKAFAEQMLAEGLVWGNPNFTFLPFRIFVVGFSYPVVPKGKARIRVQVSVLKINLKNASQSSASHTPAQIERCIDAFHKVGQQLGVIKAKN